MHELLEAVVLGIIQGFTEFLPVSSSGHIEIANHLIGGESTGEENLTMTIVLHAATAIATLIVFKNDILDILKGLASAGYNDEKRFALAIILSMVPAALVGLFFEDIVEQLFTQNMLLVGSMLIVTAVLLYLADKAKDTVKQVGFKEAIIIGLAQAVATIPGISRSGSTIATSVLLGVDRSKAARFSFLMVVPLILGKMAKDLIDGDFSNAQIDILPLVLGFIAAMITGYFACTWMIELVKKSKLRYFSIYCFIVGIIAIVSSLAIAS